MAFYVGLVWGILLPRFSDLIPALREDEDLCYDETEEHHILSDEIRRLAKTTPGLYGAIGGAETQDNWYGFMVAASNGVGGLHDIKDITPRYVGNGAALTGYMMGFSNAQQKQAMASLWKTLVASLTEKGLAGFIKDREPEFMIVFDYD